MWKLHQSRLLLSAVGNKSVFERNQSNVNPVICGAAGGVGEEDGGDRQEQEEESNGFFFVSYIQDNAKVLDL